MSNKTDSFILFLIIFAKENRLNLLLFSRKWNILISYKIKEARL